jgi:hypothetical protein
MSNQYEMERVGASAQRAQSEMMNTLKKMMENLAKSFGKGKDITIEIRVGGKTKLKGQVKDGVFTASKNELTPDDIKSLKRFFASLPNPFLKPKDFEVMVDNKTVLKTENGAVVSHATPERSEEAKQAFEAVRSPSPAEAPAQSPVPQPTAESLPSQQQSPQATVSPTPPAPSLAPEPETKTIPGLDADQNRNNRDLLEKAKCSLALLSDRPPGEREWIGKDYALIEGKDGSFRVTHQSRGEILNFTNGKVTGQATAQDVAKFNDLLAVAKQTHIPQQKKPDQKKALAVGGIKA